MSWIIREERLRPPRVYADYLVKLGGRNRFGEPNFILAWGQTRTQKIYATDGNGRRAQHTVLEFGGIPAWHVLEWKPPETFGTPRMWRAMTWDPENNVLSLGEYPRRGLYIPCSFNLYVRRVVGGGTRYDTKTGQVVELPGELKIERMPLSFWLFDLIIPNIRKSQQMTMLQRKAALEMIEEQKKKDARRQAYDAYLDASPAWGGAASSKESNREAWMQRLNEKIAGMRLRAGDLKLPRGHAQISGRKLRRK